MYVFSITSHSSKAAFKSWESKVLMNIVKRFIIPMLKIKHSIWNRCDKLTSARRAV